MEGWAHKNSSMLERHRPACRSPVLAGGRSQELSRPRFSHWPPQCTPKGQMGRMPHDVALRQSLWYLRPLYRANTALSTPQAALRGSRGPSAPTGPLLFTAAAELTIVLHAPK